MCCHNHNQDQEQSGFWRKGLKILCVAAPIIAIMALGLRSNASSLGFLPYAFFLVCPLMHLFMRPSMTGKSKEESPDKTHSEPSCH
jgi:hypothetical protein